LLELVRWKRLLDSEGLRGHSHISAWSLAELMQLEMTATMQEPELFPSRPVDVGINLPQRLNLQGNAPRGSYETKSNAESIQKARTEVFKATSGGSNCS
jgi:hypothetical protein